MESLRGLLSSPASAYDELVTGQKSIRYHWQGILSVIRALPGGLGERVESARRQLEESGATLNLLDDRAAPRWTFDPLPFVVAPDEWAALETGLIQRARLLDAILADVYGPQKLLKERLLPPMLVHANRHFHRPCQVTDGVAPKRHLGHYAVDLVRLGEPAAAAFVMANLDSMIVRPCLGNDREPIVVGMLEPEDRAALVERLRTNPGQYVAQHPFTPSLSPRWDGKGLAPAAVVMRVFVSAEGDGYRVLPGGLAREPTGDTALRSLSRLNGTLKDVWVLTEDAADVELPATRRFHQLAVERGGADLQSRVADNLFWLGRYIERLDNDSRLLRTTATRIAQGAMGPRDSVELRLLGKLLAQANLMEPASALAAPESAAFQQGLAGVASDDRGLATILDAIQRLAGTLRDRFSADMTIAAGPLMSEVRHRLLAARGNLDPLLAALDEVVRFVATLSGLSQENMTRGTGWRFLDLGRRLERGQFILTGALNSFTQSPIDWDAAMRLALELCDSTITYRTRYLGQLQPAPVLDLVVLDDSNPRALAFQLRAIDVHLDYLARASGVQVPTLPATLNNDLAAVVRQFGGDEKAWRHEGLALAMLRDVTTDADERLEALSGAITRAYFSHVPASQAVGTSAA